MSRKTRTVALRCESEFHTMQAVIRLSRTQERAYAQRQLRSSMANSGVHRRAPCLSYIGYCWQATAIVPSFRQGNGSDTAGAARRPDQK